jgi:hypothetical protein
LLQDKIYINQGVQGCNLPLALFNIYIDDLLRNWKHKAGAGIMLKRNLYLNTLLVIIQDSEDKLQKTVYMKRGKAVPLQAWSGPEGSRKLRFPDYMTTAHDGSKVVSLTHRPPLTPGNVPGTHFC